MSEPQHRTGRVTRSTGSWYTVHTEEGLVQARTRGKLRLDDKLVTNPVTVGDYVELRMDADGTGFILSVQPRRNKLSRQAAGRRPEWEHVIVANVDMAWCVQSIRLPRFKPGFIDRFLVMVEVYGMAGGVIFNKADLMTEKIADTVHHRMQIYRDIGYPVLLTSTETGQGLDEFAALLKDKTSVISGPSGVGKSTLLNAVEPGLSLKTGSVSNKTEKGRHTTTFAELFPLSIGGYVVDTPGLREFGIWDLEPEELSGYFAEMLPFVEHCRFSECTHDHEPDCAVIEAVEDGRISTERHESYLNILADLREKKQTY